MKRLIYFVCTSLLMLFSCSSGDSPSSSMTEAQITNVASTGTWKITFLNTNGGAIKTNNYQGYNFQFNAVNNSVSAVNGSNNYSGLWDVLQDPTNSGLYYFDLSFQQPPVFQQLKGLWDINSVTDNKISLHFSTTNSAYFDPTVDPTTINSNLTFEKN